MRKLYYLTLDTETATLPFVNEIALNAKMKQTISIAKPLVYDIGWTISDRNGNIIKRENYLIQETFFVPNIFNTAYYKDKRPQYMKLYSEGKIKAATWNEVIEILLADLETVNFVTAYNACFDFKKAIPFTERYIYHLYSENYNKWEEWQKKRCIDILENGNHAKNEKYLVPVFELRGNEYPLIDIWALACDRLLNTNKYRKYCCDNNFFTDSKKFFKTSAEVSYRYLVKDNDFIESHTALSDAEIETFILAKALKRGKSEPYLKAFPFRTIGTVKKYLEED